MFDRLLKRSNNFKRVFHNKSYRVIHITRKFERRLGSFLNFNSNIVNFFKVILTSTNDNINKLFNRFVANIINGTKFSKNSFTSRAKLIRKDILLSHSREF